MWPTAYRFAAGHRLRVQVSSGAHPRFARNPGTGRGLHEYSELLPADQQIFHDPEHPSAILLPVRHTS
jgi:predicted acyl esterase